MEARKQTISWSSWERVEEAGDVAKSRERQDKESERRRKQTEDEMRALVGETEELEARVRTRSRRMRGPSASPDEPPVTEQPRSETLGPPSREPPVESGPQSGRTMPSLPASSRGGRKADSGRYSFVYPPSKTKKKP